MKILFISDTHGERIEKITYILDKFKVDNIILLGDIAQNELKYIKYKTDLIKTPLYGILGNHDSFDSLSRHNIENIHNKIITLGGIRFLGFEGSAKYKPGNYYPSFTQEESEYLLKKAPSCDILVSHDTRTGLYKGDAVHTGLSGIGTYMDKRNVSLNIHGHHHINNTIELKNKIYKCVYQFSIIDINLDTFEIDTTNII